MAVKSDFQLLREYTQDGSEEAFKSLVDRHLNLVYSVARARLANESAAKDITQVVFAALARKAGHLSEKVVLSGWLFQAATHACQDLLRAEARRAKRETEAMQQQITESAPEHFEINPLAPEIGGALASLATSERDAILLRFFEERGFQQIGAQLGISEAAAKMRVARGLQRLRHQLQKRGITVSEAALCGFFPHLIQTAPAGLGATIKTGVATQAALSACNTALLKGVLKAMAWTKAKTAIVVGVGVLLAAGTTTLALKTITARRALVWQEQYDTTVLDKVPPQVKILPALHSRSADIDGWGSRNGKWVGLGVSSTSIVQAAYDASLGRLIFSVPVPEGRYDFISSLRSDQQGALQQEVKKKFGIVVRRELIQTNVLVLSVRNRDAIGLTPSADSDAAHQNNNRSKDSISCVYAPMSKLAELLENALKIPVVDRTGLTGHFDIYVKWDSTTEGLKKAVLEQMGLELAPDLERIEFLVVEKAN